MFEVYRQQNKEFYHSFHIFKSGSAGSTQLQPTKPIEQKSRGTVSMQRSCCGGVLGFRRLHR
jgi:hypothetical protein